MRPANLNLTGLFPRQHSRLYIRTLGSVASPLPRRSFHLAFSGQLKWMAEGDLDTEFGADQVDSDQDLSPNEDEGQVGGRAGTSKGGKGKGRSQRRDDGDGSYGASKPAKKKARRSASTTKKRKGPTAAITSPAPTQPEYNAELLLQLPFDLLAEVCAHLRNPDLVSLAKASRTFRKLFLSSTTRSIWATQRRQDGYELLSDMDELTFAHLLKGSSCQQCGSSRAHRMFVFHVRLCEKCAGQHFVSAGQARALIKGLHDHAFACVPSAQGLFRLADLEEVDEQLQVLEDEDEETRSQNQRLSVGTTRSRRRTSGPIGEPKEADAVKNFVEERTALVMMESDAVERIWDRREELQEEELEALVARQRSRREAEELEMRLRRDALQDKHEWTTEQCDFYASPWRRGAWLAYREAIQARLDEKEAERQAEPGRVHRLDILRNLLDTLKDDLEDELRGVFPNFKEFKELPEIKPLWHPVDAQLEDEGAAKELPVGRAALRAFADRMRVEAIRLILAAQDNTPLSKISKDPSQYPADKYDDEFFARITSLFFGVPTRPYYIQFSTAGLPYPACVPFLWPYDGVQQGLAGGIGYKQVCAVRTVVEAAGLDEDTVTTDDLDALGKTFTWLTSPCVSRRHFEFTWSQMVHLILRRGPGVRKLKQGVKIQIECNAPNRKGKGRAPQPASSMSSDEEDSKDFKMLSSDDENDEPVPKKQKIVTKADSDEDED
ncbi:hypothetical protein JCM11251_000937 [Rhodosporidiobolus azoricus]